MTHDLEVWDYLTRKRRGLSLRDFVRLHFRRPALCEHADEQTQDDKRRAKEEQREERRHD